MKYTFETEFRTDHPETTNETDKQFDLVNYTHWLENKLSQQQTITDNQIIEIKRQTLKEVEKFIIKKIKQDKLWLEHEEKTKDYWSDYHPLIHLAEGTVSAGISMKKSISKWRKKLSYDIKTTEKNDTE
jgi:hypothetical protein